MIFGGGRVKFWKREDIPRSGYNPEDLPILCSVRRRLFRSSVKMQEIFPIFMGQEDKGPEVRRYEWNNPSHSKGCRKEDLHFLNILGLLVL